MSKPISELDSEAVAAGVRAAREGKDDNPYRTSGSDLLATVITGGLLGPVLLTGKDSEKADAWDIGHALENKKK